MTAPCPLAVLLDAGPAVHQHAGLSRYTQRIAATLQAEAADAVTLRLFYNRHSDHALPPALTGIPASTLRLGQYGWRLSVLASQLTRLPYLPLARQQPRFDLYHATEHLLPRLSRPTVLTVHDLIFERFPEHHTLTNRAFLRLAMPLFVRAATQIIAVSRHTARDLTELYQVPNAKITVVYEGVDPMFRPAPPVPLATLDAAIDPARPYLLMVGTLEPRKNHQLALAALARLKASGYPHQLLVVGGRGWLFAPIHAQVVQLGMEGDVHFTGYVPDALLPGLYSGATALLLPSVYEGFGFPLLEAMACGAPVIASDASSLPELAGDAALVTPVGDLDALVAAIRRMIDEPGLAQTLRVRGFARAKEFTWSAAARQTVDVYHAAASSTSDRR